MSPDTIYKRIFLFLISKSKALIEFSKPLISVISPIKLFLLSIFKILQVLVNFTIFFSFEEEKLFLLYVAW